MTFLLYSLLIGFVHLSEQIANVSINNIHWMIFVMEMSCVFCETGTELPITVAGRGSKASSNTGIVDSNPTGGMDVYVRLFCVCVVLCVDSGLATG
jgi:hypothetical protein